MQLAKLFHDGIHSVQCEIFAVGRLRLSGKRSGEPRYTRGTTRDFPRLQQRKGLSIPWQTLRLVITPQAPGEDETLLIVRQKNMRTATRLCVVDSVDW